jgi:ubiquinone/menaquinone biosynthesis C-methylase UbiE
LADEYEVREECISKADPLEDSIRRYLQAKHKAKLIDNIVPINGKNVLDFGAGSGSFIAYVKNHYYEVTPTVYDPSKHQLAAAKQLYKFKDEALIHDVSLLAKDSYDIICAFYVYAYVKDKDKFWKLMSSLLKQGGYLFVEVDCERSLYYKLSNFRVSKDWWISKRDLPFELKLQKIMASPMPSHYYQRLFSNSPSLSDSFITAASKVSGMPQHEIFVFRKA